MRGLNFEKQTLAACCIGRNGLDLAICCLGDQRPGRRISRRRVARAAPHIPLDFGFEQSGTVCTDAPLKWCGLLRPVCRALLSSRLSRSCLRKREKMMTKTTTESRPRTASATKGSRNNLPPSRVAPATKKARLVKLLRTKAGADISSISKRFGWQPHTTRAALSRLRKSGYEISNMKTGAGKLSKYHITGVPPENKTQ